MRKNKHEQGQAITELVVGLIGIAIMFVGLLLVAVFSMENVRCLILARGEAEVASAQGTVTGGGKSPSYITEWSWGADQIPFTADDSPVTGGIQANALTEEFDTSLNTLTDDPANAGKNGLYIRDMNLNQLTGNRYLSNLVNNSGFLAAADLTSYTAKSDDPLGNRGLPDMGNSLSVFFGTKKITLEDTVFLPSRVENENSNPE